MKGVKIILNDLEPPMNSNSKVLANVIISRMGLEPRKSGSTEHMYKILIELYERMKKANKEKKPEYSVMSVEELAIYASITRQTMYEYIKRWLDLNLIVKTSYIKDARVVIGYKLNGNTLESSFEKARNVINNNLEFTLKYVRELQRIIKNEKLSMAAKEKD